MTGNFIFVIIKIANFVILWRDIFSRLKFQKGVRLRIEKGSTREAKEELEYGYVRAQTGQNLKKQIAILAERVGKENVVADEGGNTNFRALKEKLRPGDLLVIKTLDKLGSNYEGILREWTQITEGLRADILVLDMPLLDTRKREEGVPVGGIVQQFLTFAAEKEKRRTTLQAQGIRKAKERGVRFGRPRIEYTEEFIATVEAFRKKEITLQQALDSTGIKKSSFYYHMHRLIENGIVTA